MGLFATSPALLGDDHLGLVPVELEPQRPVAEEHLGPGPGARAGQGHVAESGPGARVRMVDAAWALSQLVGWAEVAAPAGWSGKSRGGQHGTQVERRGIPASAGRGVHRPTWGIGDKRAGAGRLWALLGARGWGEVAVSGQPVLCVPVAISRFISIRCWRLASHLCCVFGESAGFSFTAEHVCFCRLLPQEPVGFFDFDLKLLLSSVFLLIKNNAKS